METPPRCKFAFILSIIIYLFLGFLSFSLCIVSEIKRNKKEDLRWNGKLCYLPSSQAFGLGIAALVSFFLAQIIGNSILFKNSYSRRKVNAEYKLPFIARFLILISWLSFGIAIILLIAATSMNRKQAYGAGWLNGECYLVKGGTYAGSAILVLVTVGSIIGSTLSTIKTNQADQGGKIHAQMGLSFGIAIILLIAATSMNRKQAHGAGWLNGECYLVKGGTYAGSAILVLVTGGSIIGSALSTIKTNQPDQGSKIHAQMG